MTVLLTIRRRVSEGVGRFRGTVQPIEEVS
jgi:hypothetical protein